MPPAPKEDKKTNGLKLFLFFIIDNKLANANIIVNNNSYKF